MRVLEYRDKIDYEFLKKECSNEFSVYTCLEKQFEMFLTGVSLTGTSMGLKMVFTVMDDDRAHVEKVITDKNVVNFMYLINYLEVNNLALRNVYQRYFGFSFLYGGFIASVQQYYKKGQRFSQDIITGLEGAEGLILIKEDPRYEELSKRFENVKKNYYQIKSDGQNFLENEWKRISKQ